MIFNKYHKTVRKENSRSDGKKIELPEQEFKGILSNSQT
jgi:hypothetical protein